MPETRVPPFHGNISFNAQHSPMGAFMSFTCGHFGTRGGFGLQIGKPGNQDLYIGVKDGDRFSDAPLKCLPFYQGALQAPHAAAERTRAAADFLVEQAGPTEQNVQPKLIPYRSDQIKRHYGWATDRWVTEDFEFTIYTPFETIPELGGYRESDLPLTILPAMPAEIFVDNRHGTSTKTAFFAINFNEPGMRPLSTCLPELWSGFALRRHVGFIGSVFYPEVGKPLDALWRADCPLAFCRWEASDGIRNEQQHLLGTCPGLAMEVPPGELRRMDLVLGCYLDGIISTRLHGRYYYTNFYTSLEDVLRIASLGGSTLCSRLDDELLASGLSPDQQFLIAHATRSYYGSTQLLDVGGQPFWVVNEGEYCMMNTLDLSVDQMFWELKHNPWVVRNVLDNFVRHYSYHDQVKAPQRDTGFQPVRAAHDLQTNPQSSESERPEHRLKARVTNEQLAPGGISFCHDMGVHNNFSPFGHSSYELPNLTGCFSYMTAEQLCNWILMAATYVHSTGDTTWAAQNVPILTACLSSLRNRGGEVGFVQLDSSRCESGSEITTYDSLDHSLAQTRNNVYIAVKCWASHLGLAIVLEKLNHPDAATARQQAAKIEQVLGRHVGPDGVFPAVFEKDNPGHASRILPAVEGLMYPLAWGRIQLDSPFVQMLKRHTLALLDDPQRRNLFPDAGIRLSSTSDNSWMSKIAIFQHVARRVFHLDDDPKIRELFERADTAHVKWQTDGSGYWACSDQFVNGVAKGSRYYPRIITAALWMEQQS